MAGAEFRNSVKPSGPIFDGLAPEMIDKFMLKATDRLAETARDWIKIDAEGDGQVGPRRHRPRRRGVELQPQRRDDLRLGAMTQGEVRVAVAGRHQQAEHDSTGFRGYHTFRNAKQKLADHTDAIIQPLVDDLVRELGGAP